MAVKNEMGTLLAMASITARENVDMLRGSENPSDYLLLAFWDGVRRMSEVSIATADRTTTARAALLGLVDYAENIRKTIEDGDDDDEGEQAG